MSDIRFRKWMAIAIVALLVANMAVAAALYSSASKVAVSADAAGELSSLEKEVLSLRVERSVFRDDTYPLERYSLLYNRALSFLTIVVVLSAGATLWLYRRMLATVEPESRILFDIREKLESIKQMASTMPELKEEQRESLMADINSIGEEIDKSAKWRTLASSVSDLKGGDANER